MGSATRDKPLTNDEIAELDELLGSAPEGRAPFDASTLDGFLVGVLLQPEAPAQSDWLRVIFDVVDEGTEFLPDAASTERAIEFIMRRHAELAAFLAAREAFDPILAEIETDANEPAVGAEALAAMAPWAAGFLIAAETYHLLYSEFAADSAVREALGGILRHVPKDAISESVLMNALAAERAEADADYPLITIDDAIEDLVARVLEIAVIARPHRPMERDAPKLGRNDPCHCGSGRKFKHCHGAS